MSKKGLGAVYGSLTKATARKEIEQWASSVGRVATSKKVKLSNVLDLRDARVQRKLGVTLDDITGDDYTHTQRIGEWALREGFTGIIAPSARFPGRANLVVFGGF